MIFLILFLAEIFILFFLSRALTRLLSQVFFRISRSQTKTIYLLSFLFLPGVAIHELAHLLVAAVLLVPVGEVEFMPKLSEGGVKLGSVAIGQSDPFRRAIIGVAPVMVGLTILLGIGYYFMQSNSIVYTIEPATLRIFLYALSVYFLFAISNTMFSSRKDVEGLLEVLLVILIVLIALYFTGFRLNFSLSEGLSQLLKTSDIFLLVPLTLDVFLYGVIKILSH